MRRADRLFKLVQLLRGRRLSTAAWLAGDRTYYCFVDRVSGGNLPGDLAIAKASTAG